MESAPPARLASELGNPDLPGPDALPVRRAAPADAARLAAFMERTFRDTYAATTSPEQLERHVGERFGEPQQAGELADPAIETLVVERAGEHGPELVAFAQLRRGSRAPACVDAARPAEVMRFYVDRAWHGRGIAARLMDACVAAAAPADALWLLVYNVNDRALAFYAKCGFARAGTHPYHFGDEVHDDVVMVRRLGEGD